MQCGPIRYRMATEDSGIPRQLIVRVEAGDGGEGCRV